MGMSEGGNKDFIATTIIIIVNVKHKRKQTEITEGLIFERTKRNFEKKWHRMVSCSISLELAYMLEMVGVFWYFACQTALKKQYILFMTEVEMWIAWYKL